MEDWLNLTHVLFEQVCMHTCADVIQSVPFFDDAEDGFVASLVTMLRPQVFITDGICHQGARHPDLPSRSLLAKKDCIIVFPFATCQLFSNAY